MYLLLSDENFFRMNFDSHISSGNHDAVRLRDDLVNVVHALLVLDLGHDLDFLALVAENLSDLTNACGITNERREDYVDIVLYSKLEVLNILLANGRLKSNNFN